MPGPTSKPGPRPGAGSAPPRRVARDAANGGSTLRRDLGLFSASSLVVGGVVGSGIFFGPQEVAAVQPFTLLVLAAWLLGGLISLLGALSIAELGAALPHSGGTYVYLREAWGPLPAFLSGWGILITGDGLAAIALVFGTFAQVALPWGPGPVAFAVALIVLLTLTNLLGVKEGAWVQNASTVLKVGALGLLVAVGLLAAPGARDLTPLLPPAEQAGSSLVLLLGVALVPVLYAYDGWYYAARVGEEVRDPGRNLPRSIILGTLAVTALYFVVNLTYVAVLGPSGLAAVAGAQGAGASSAILAGQASPALAVADAALGPAAVVFVLVAVLVSTAGASNTSVLTAPRSYLAMARDGLFFAPLARVHPRFGTPHLALLAHGGVAVALAMTGSFLQIILLSTLSTFIFVGLAVLGMMRLRRTRPDLPRPYRTPGYPWVPAAFLLLTALFIAAAAWAEPLLVGGFLGMVGVGVVVYALVVRQAPGQGPGRGPARAPGGGSLPHPTGERVVVLGEVPNDR